MEKTFKGLGYILIIYLLSSYGLAYNSSRILVNETVTFDEIPNRLLDGVASHKDKVADFGATTVDYMITMVFLLLIILLAIIFWRLKSE